MSLRDIVNVSNRKADLDNDMIKENVRENLEKYRELIAY